MIADEGASTKINSKMNDESVKSFIENFRAVITTKDSQRISSFLQYYSTADAKFYQTSELYLEQNMTTPFKTQNIELNRIEYGAYLYESVTHSIDYVSDITSIDIKPLNEDSAVATVLFSEKYKQNGDYPNIVMVDVYSSCNITLIYKTTILISGANCIEKVYTKNFANDITRS